ncbi:MAG: rod shape-determining protein MreC [Bergeyella sp.]|nr:rod shape-determining protein MreC [Bergeyella sp.]
MGFLLRFFAKRGFFLFFVSLQIVSVFLIFSSNYLQKSFLVSQIRLFDFTVDKYISSWESYFRLEQTNESLVKQNIELMQSLYKKDKNGDGVASQENKDSIDVFQTPYYTFIEGDIINNSINRNNNHIVINKGKKEGVISGMGVISPEGIAGIVINTTDHYSLAQSILSTKNIKINASLKKSGYFGTLVWNGQDTRIMNLSDIPKYVSVKIGDTVITGGKSDVFPKGTIIGTVAGYEVNDKTGFLDISVELKEKMGKLSKVYIVTRVNNEELERIQGLLKIEQKKDDQ